MFESSDSDVCVVPSGSRTADQLVPHRGVAPSRGQYRKRGGEHLRDWRVAPPPSVITLVAKVDGKWSDAFGEDSGLSRELTQLSVSNEAASDLLDRVGAILSGNASACVVVGFALVESWKFLDSVGRPDEAAGSPVSLMAEHFRRVRNSRSQLGLFRMLCWIRAC